MKCPSNPSWKELVAVYPVFVMVGGRVLMKEKVGFAQYACLMCIMTGTVMVVTDALI